VHLTFQKLCCFFLFLLLLGTQARAQTAEFVAGAQAAAMGNSALHNVNSWALYNNTANLAWLTESEASFAYHNRYQQPGFNTLVAAGAAPMKWGAMGAGVYRFGDNIFNQQMLSVGAAHKVGEVGLGLRADWVQYQALGAGSRNLLSINASTRLRLAERIWLAAHLRNLTQSKLTNSPDQNYPSSLQLAVSYEPIEEVKVAAEIFQDFDADAVLRLGVSYQLPKLISLHLGAATQPNSLSGGLTFRTGKFDFNYAIYTHPRLPISHVFGASVFPAAFKAGR
jgi:hypothetical protein